MDKTEKQRLKDFIEDHFPFDALKQAGFWPKGTRRTDYEKIAARVCKFFGYESIYEYARDVVEVQKTNVDGVFAGKTADTITPAGELKTGGTFLLHCGAATSFACPICTKAQDAHDYARFRRTPEYAPVKCSGCKRKLLLSSCPMTGKFEVTER
jgi:hypothetical protein